MSNDNLDAVWKEFVEPISTSTLYGKYEKPATLVKLESLVEEDSIDLELLGFYLDEIIPYPTQPLDMIPFATTGTDGAYFAFLTDFGAVTNLEEAPIIMYCAADFSYEDPSNSFCLFAKNIKDFLAICTQIYNPYFVYEGDPKDTNFDDLVEEFLEDEFQETDEIIDLARLLIKHLHLDKIDNLNEYYLSFINQRQNNSGINTRDGLKVNFKEFLEEPNIEITESLGENDLSLVLSKMNKSSRLKFYRDFGCVFRELTKDESLYVLEVIGKFLKEDGFIRENEILNLVVKKKRAYNLYHKLKNSKR